MASSERTNETNSPAAAAETAIPAAETATSDPDSRLSGDRTRPRSEGLGSRTAGPSTSARSEEITDRQSFQITCLRDARYHEDRERFFAKIHKGTMFIVVAAGTAAIAPVETKSLIFPAIITLTGLVDLVFDVSGKARLHASLRRRIYELLADAQDEGSDLNKLRKRAIDVYADEPPCMHAVNMLAYNGAMAAFERPPILRIKITNWQRMFRNFWSFSSTDFKTFEELQREAAQLNLSRRL
jgi:hypothetical protein